MSTLLAHLTQNPPLTRVRRSFPRALDAEQPPIRAVITSVQLPPMITETTTSTCLTDVASYPMFTDGRADTLWALGANYSVLADTGSVAFLAPVAKYSMLTDRGAPTLGTRLTSFAVLADAGSVALLALVAIYSVRTDLLAPTLGAPAAPFLVHADLAPTTFDTIHTALLVGTDPLASAWHTVVLESSMRTLGLGHVCQQMDTELVISPETIALVL